MASARKRFASLASRSSSDWVLLTATLHDGLIGVTEGKEDYPMIDHADNIST
jgi:hypothetical protein